MEVITETDRILFIRPHVQYVQDMINALSNPEVSKLLGDSLYNLSIEEEIEWINSNQDGNTFSLITKDTNEFIGNCGFNEINDNYGEIGIFLSPRFQNIGLGTEALTELIRFGFENLNLDEIRLVVYSHNERAISCYQRLGFTEYRRDVDIARRNNQRIDDVYMSLRR